MIGPKKRPQDCGFRPGDSHLIVNDITERAKAFSFSGQLLWEIPCLARGQGSDYDWAGVGTDTPPGLYKIGAIYRDYEIDPVPVYSRNVMAYGWYSFDLVELEGQEQRHGRAGIMIHGGGSACGFIEAAQARARRRAPPAPAASGGGRRASAGAACAAGERRVRRAGGGCRCA